jgi:hypothetical protein
MFNTGKLGKQLFQLLAVAFALLLHLVSNTIMFNTGKLGKQTELAHHDLHDSNKKPHSDYVGRWQCHFGKAGTAKTGLW